MGFWKETGYPYLKLVEIPEERLLLLVNAMSREDIQEWLMWNDPNGIYSDKLSIKEFGRVMTKDEGLEILLRQIEENRIVK